MTLTVFVVVQDCQNGEEERRKYEIYGGEFHCSFGKFMWGQPGRQSSEEVQLQKHNAER
jgi:hypothetical protein